MSKEIEKIAMGAKPDPYNFNIVKIEYSSGNTIVLANYPGSLTFGRNKLMLMKGIQGDFTTLDPHFLDSGHPVVARFIPNADGWKLARLCAGQLK